MTKRWWEAPQCRTIRARYRSTGRQLWSVSVLDNGVEHPLVEGTRISLRFNNGNIAASAGCNSMSGPYQIDDNRQLTVEDLSTTEIGCDP